MASLLVRNAHLLITMNDLGSTLSGGSVLVRDGRIGAVSAGPLQVESDEVMDASHHVVLPGLVNTHHHLCQTLTRNLPAVQNARLFDWLSTLYRVWRHLDEEAVRVSAQVGMAELLLSGCTTTTDHHYLFPQRGSARFIDAEIEAAREMGIRFHPTRGSMSLGQSRGGLPPDDVVQRDDEILKDSLRLIEAYHDPRDYSLCQVALAPCSLFSVTSDLMRETARLARDKAVRLHTHLAETLDEERYCQQVYGRRPLDYLESVGWLGPDVWLAHCVHLNGNEVTRLGKTGTGVAHCPTSNLRLGSGIAPVPAMLGAGVRVGLGVDGSASNDTSHLLQEARQALLVHRLSPDRWLTAADVLGLATRGGAAVLGRKDIGSIEPGKAADLVLIDLRRLNFAGALSDPLAAVLFSFSGGPVDTVIVHGRVRVREGHLVGVDERALIERANGISAALLSRA
ncbi:MAG: 8-oxoguanine deaminase [Acidobacteria bacterium]|nr:8-oxoguanine deaminase [Acidobacteriota bacterium]